ncbi:AsmA family protein [Parahaliea aestuarii]|uniref:AsmA family protein n=1 Tax=Parahaliea aestuarii TaxID=1852021 RepID=A0A5C8ZUG0_9GAMM|nr:AsmA family protein [Parahaliea aestuarii]TXS91097.1 AsmA family protein [Parahaliea aestuarii]
MIAQGQRRARRSVLHCRERRHYCHRMRLLAVLLISLLLCAALLAGAGVWVLQSPQRSIATLKWAVSQFSDLRLELNGAQLQLTEDKVSARQILLYQDGSDNLPLLSIHNFHATLKPHHLPFDRLRNASLSADNLTVYIASHDSTKDPGPASWMAYLRWLPRQLHIGSVHLIRHGEDILVFPLQQLSGERESAGSYRLHAVGDYDGEPLDTTVYLYALHNTRGFRGIQLRADLHATRSSRLAILEGEVLGGVDDFSYDFSLNAALPDINRLAGFGDSLAALEGALQVRGRLQGDDRQFRLTEAEFALLNAPRYEFIARGSFDYRGPGDTLLQAEATGHLEELGLLLNWIEADFSNLGSAAAELTIEGPVDALAVPRFTLQTRHQRGLELSLQGSLAPGALTGSSIQPEDNEVQLLARGSGLDVLHPWIGELPFEPGPWQLEATLGGSRDQLALSGIKARLGANGQTQLHASGAIGTVDLTPPVALTSVRDIDIKLELEAPTLAQIRQWFDLDIDSEFRLTASALATGNADSIRFSAGSARLEDSDLSIVLTSVSGELNPEGLPRQLRADIAASLSDTSALSQYLTLPVPVLGAVNLTGRLQQADAGWRLDNLRGGIDSEQLALKVTGSIDDLTTLAGTRLALDFARLDLRNLIHSQLDDFRYPQPLGHLAGTLELQQRDGHWHLPAFAVNSDDNRALYLTARGSASDLLGQTAGEMAAELAISSPALLKALSGRNLAPLRAQLKANAEGDRLNLSARGTLGENPIDVSAELRHEQRAITALKARLSAPSLHLADLGLQAGDTSPAPKASTGQADASLEGFIANLPPYPLDLQLQLGRLRGDSIDVQDIDLALEGSAGRYLLRRMNFRGGQGHLELAGVIDLAAKPPALSLGGQALSLNMRQLINDLGLQADVTGVLSLRGGVSARGHGAAEWLGSLDGNLSMALQAVEIQGAAYDLLATDLLAWIYSGAALETSTHVDCSMASFTLRSGIARSENLYIESPRMLATGTGTFNLVQQTLDVRIKPLSKSRVLQIPSAVTLSGSMKKPRTWVSPIAATADASAEALMLIPKLTMKLLGLDRERSGPVRPCEALPPA